MKGSPYVFDEFFISGMQEKISPFLTPASKNWSRCIPAISVAASTLSLIIAFSLSFLNPSISYLFLTMVYFLSGTPALIHAIDDLKNFEINIDILMTVAAFLALFIDSALEGALLLVLFEISHTLEDTVSQKARSALHNLNTIAPKIAHVIDQEGIIFEKAVKDITIGTKLLIKQGEVVPLDGHVLSGISSVNLVHLTGESIPDVKKEGDSIPAGARNLDAALVVEVTRTSSDSTLSKIIELITAAHDAKPKVQKTLDRFGKVYATSIISLTFIFSLLLPFLFSIPFLGMEGAIYRSLAFLIAASPCALIIATPTAYLSAISSCAKKGILLKGGVTLDALSSCKMIAFDKTGTLTTGQLDCTAIEPLTSSSITLDEALAIAAALEHQVVHPIATAICKLAAEKKLSLPDLLEFKAIPGFGLKAKLISGIPVSIGLPEQIAKELEIKNATELQNWIQSEKNEGTILAALTIGDQIFTFRFTDQVRHKVPELIRKIETKNQLTPIILTGDREKNAVFVSNLLGISRYFANLKPEDKLKKVAEMSETHGLAMVGDGINDAPALARATVGISMGRIGSATAIDASDVVLLNDDLSLLHDLFLKSKKTKKIVKQNLIVAFSVICFASMPALFGLIPLWLAVFLHEGGTVLVGLNSLRLLR